MAARFLKRAMRVYADTSVFAVFPPSLWEGIGMRAARML